MELNFSIRTDTVGEYEWANINEIPGTYYEVRRKCGESAVALVLRRLANMLEEEAKKHRVSEEDWIAYAKGMRTSIDVK